MRGPGPGGPAPRHGAPARSGHPRIQRRCPTGAAGRDPRWGAVLAELAARGARAGRRTARRHRGRRVGTARAGRGRLPGGAEMGIRCHGADRGAPLSHRQRRRRRPRLLHRSAAPRGGPQPGARRRRAGRARRARQPWVHLRASGVPEGPGCDPGRCDRGPRREAPRPGHRRQRPRLRRRGRGGRRLLRGRRGNLADPLDGGPARRHAGPAALPDHVRPLRLSHGGEQRGKCGHRALDRGARRRGLRPAGCARRARATARVRERELRPARGLRGAAGYSAAADRGRSRRRTEERPAAAFLAGRRSAGRFPRPRTTRPAVERAGAGGRGVSLGHASLLGLDDTIPGRAVLKHLWRFAAAESCGTCSPCRIGSLRGLEFARRGDLPSVRQICATMHSASLCAFGPGVAQAVRSVLRVYVEELEAGASR